MKRTDTLGAVKRINKYAALWKDEEIPADGVWDEEYNMYITGSGQILVKIHPMAARCVEEGCVIHAPSDHNMRDFPTFWRYDAYKMERTCPHGIGHPDPDDLRYRNGIDPKNASVNGIHGCDNCCLDAEEIERRFNDAYPTPAEDDWSNEGGFYSNRDFGDETDKR